MPHWNRGSIPTQTAVSKLSRAVTNTVQEGEFPLPFKKWQLSRLSPLVLKSLVASPSANSDGR